MNYRQGTYLVSLLLLIGGFGALAAGASIYFSAWVSIGYLECGFQGADCVGLAELLDRVVILFSGVGAVAMILGGVGMWSLRGEGE